MFINLALAVASVNRDQLDERQLFGLAEKEANQLEVSDPFRI